MLKRNKDSVPDVLASNDVYVSVSKTPSVTKVIWHVDPPSIGPDSESKRNSPEVKYLKALSAFLTLMVLWGIFSQVHTQLIPLFHLAGTSSHHSHAGSLTLAQRRTSANAFKGDLSADLGADLVSSVGGRSVSTKRLLEAQAEQIPNPQEQSEETSYRGSLGPVLHRKLLSGFHHAATN